MSLIRDIVPKFGMTKRFAQWCHKMANRVYVMGHPNNFCYVDFWNRAQRRRKKFGKQWPQTSLPVEHLMETDCNATACANTPNTRTILILIKAGGQLSSHRKYRDYSRTEHPIDLGPVCKLEFVYCGQDRTTKDPKFCQTQDFVRPKIIFNPSFF